MYTSPDLLTWRYLGVAAESNGSMGDMWECPDLFPLGDGDGHVLIISPMNMGTTKTMYLTGKLSYEMGKFDYRLRKERESVARQVIPADTIVSLESVQGDQLELIVVFNTKGSGAEAVFGLLVRCSEDGSEYTEVSYSVEERILRVDRTRAGSGEAGVSEVQVEPLEDGSIRLHLFVDRSSVELFANDGVKTITNRIYPKVDSLGIKLFARHGEATLESLDVWQLSL